MIFSSTISLLKLSRILTIEEISGYFSNFNFDILGVAFGIHRKCKSKIPVFSKTRKFFMKSGKKGFFLLSRSFPEVTLNHNQHPGNHKHARFQIYSSKSFGISKVFIIARKSKNNQFATSYNMTRKKIIKTFIKGLSVDSWKRNLFCSFNSARKSSIISA